MKPKNIIIKTLLPTFLMDRNFSVHESFHRFVYRPPERRISRYELSLVGKDRREQLHLPFIPTGSLEKIRGS
jgi:hypothetical protein